MNHVQFYGGLDVGRCSKWMSFMLVFSEVNRMKDIKKVRLVKSKTNKLLTGVCGGIGELIGIDPTIIRLIWAALSLAGGSGVILYIIAAIIIPEDDDIIDAE